MGRGRAVWAPAAGQRLAGAEPVPCRPQPGPDTQVARCQHCQHSPGVNTRAAGSIYSDAALVNIGYSDAALVNIWRQCSGDTQAADKLKVRYMMLTIWI